jgi:hypothetical protein
MAMSENYARIPGIDPYIDWVLGPGKPYYFRPGRQDDWLYVLIRLTKISARDFAQGEGFTTGADNARWRTAVHIPLLFIEDSTDDGTRDLTCPALVREDFFVMLRASARIRQNVVGVSLSLPLAQSLPVVPMPVFRLPARTTA